MRRASHIVGVAVVIVVAMMSTRSPLAHGPAEERIRELTACIDGHAADADLFLERADLYREIGDLASALSDYDCALRADAARHESHLGRAWVLAQLGDFDAALAAVDAFLSRSPAHADAWRVRARSLAGLGRVVEAARALDRAIALARNPVPDDYLDRAELLASLGGARLDEAIAGLDAGLALLGPAVTLELLAVELERRRGACDAALARLDALAPRYDRVESILVARGDVLAQAGRAMEADAAYTDALRAIEDGRVGGRWTPAAARLRDDVLRKLARVEGE